MGKFDKEKYKRFLIPYLQHMGVDANGPGLIRCISPTHADRHPSCQLTETSFHCWTCDCSGDIYEAVKVLTGETDFVKQYEEIDRLFGDGTAAPLTALPQKNPNLHLRKKTSYQIQKLCKTLRTFLKAFRIPMNMSETTLQSVLPFLLKAKSHNIRRKFFQSL